MELNQYQIDCKNVFRNTETAVLYEHAIRFDQSSKLTDKGALVAYSGEKTGRSPKDKRIVDHPESRDNVWWGDVNMKIDDETFEVNKERALDYLNTCERLYVVDGFAGWDPKYRVKVRIICSRPYHALFMKNMLIRPSQEELDAFGEPDYVIYNAGSFPANRHTSYMTSKTSVDLHLEKREMVILGTQYAGEMKKGVFTIMNYLMPKNEVLSMHCSANASKDGDVSLFFGLSGTGKTTLSTDEERLLIGDDEICWTDDGVFNIEGGCYAKCIDLKEESEPDIYHAIRYGALLENVVLDDHTRQVDYTDESITPNTRVSYPIEFIKNVQHPCVGQHPKDVIFLTADAFGVLPPVSLLTPEQAIYHFISGYTSKIPGTEMGVVEPKATFSPCFGGAFMMWHPMKYAELLEAKVKQQDARVWLVNTGWFGGAFGVGKRYGIAETRRIIHGIQNGELADGSFEDDGFFGLKIPTVLDGFATEKLRPINAWQDQDEYRRKAELLKKKFQENFKQYEDQVPQAVIDGMK
ncbi:phosphoenolpyruvate carboxykinase (ATP) [Pseudobacteriovorax antillogorgiicola]|uniref:Phosphoenolpyruvate carboxykinase (ATP) n=1 Tax=Pseudobacteriovorax antillogorgiicola TaxID=1513793 RepID=A0A1Y6BIJ6_9BACT|nr:phosphoenolpyruvate carboxykinase (ATP) [Pseudobacteriovorax antillogorgiicola]TCS55519.1 phosphoenolpyruvate carboxykinase (ATP) [Pseudobacteriovorax antillogorgiicola]SMF11383.1 phosphoenolpyruvate carboxykinase (ATP) [Pseudobacteriovorax antillogorgiicola]